MYRVLYSVLIALTLIWPSASESATVNYNAGGYVIGINNLVVGSDLYNVIFERDIFENVFTPPTGTPFWSDAIGAQNAVNAINNVLNGISDPPLPSIIDNNQFEYDYYVPYEYGIPPNGLYYVNCMTGHYSPTNYGSSGLSGRWNNEVNSYAMISAVPLPGTVLLLCSGLIGLIGLRRKFKK